jgi:hypothetical protein
MSTITCPVCGGEHDDGDYPDILNSLGARQQTTFECDCGVEFELHVDFEPIYYVLNDTVKKMKATL